MLFFQQIKAESDGDHDDEQGDADQVEKSNGNSAWDAVWSNQSVL